MIKKIFRHALAAAFAAIAVQACHSATPPAAPPAMHFAQTVPAAQPPTQSSTQSGAQIAPSALVPSQAAQTASPQAAPAQQAAPGAEQSDVNAPTIKINANEVSLIFTVTNKHGQYVPNLQQSDFALLDDGRAPARVNSFHQQINLPLRVGIVVDASTSIRSRFQFEQQAATEFLLQVVKPRSDRAFVMGFDVTPTIEQDWTDNLDALEQGIDRMRPGGGTALFDAVYTACRDKLLTERGQEPVRKAMVLISDGDDNQSRAYLDDAIKMCERAETIVYAISTNWTPSRGKGDQVLEKLAESTGGQAFFPPSVEEMSTSFKNIEEELRSQYALIYTPADFKYDGSFRPIYLYCNDRRYQVRAKKGYFAPRQ
jgi:Ca-activated chloride channel homolog